MFVVSVRFSSTFRAFSNVIILLAKSKISIYFIYFIYLEKPKINLKCVISKIALADVIASKKKVHGRIPFVTRANASASLSSPKFNREQGRSASLHAWIWIYAEKEARVEIFGADCVHSRSCVSTWLICREARGLAALHVSFFRARYTHKFFCFEFKRVFMICRKTQTRRSSLLGVNRRFQVSIMCAVVTDVRAREWEPTAPR